jgi:hypothetical protein
MCGESDSLGRLPTTATRYQRAPVRRRRETYHPASQNDMVRMDPSQVDSTIHQSSWCRQILRQRQRYPRTCHWTRPSRALQTAAARSSGVVEEQQQDAMPAVIAAAAQREKAGLWARVRLAAARTEPVWTWKSRPR